MADSRADSTTTVTAKCHCGQLTASVTVPNSALPLPLWLCSCDTCRMSSGHIAITCAFLPPKSSRSPLGVDGTATRYQTSTGPSALIRCFCPTCGAFVYEDSPDPNRQSLYGGALTRTEGIVENKGITFNSDAKDGGLAPLLPGFRAWEGQMDGGAGGDGGEPAWTTSVQDQGSEASEEGAGDDLVCRCHCGGVDFRITRPDGASVDMDVNLEGLFYPNLTDGEWVENTWDIKWWVRGENRDKYAAVLCMCESCRKTSGFDIQNWAFVPAANLRTPSGALLRIPEDLPALTAYRSSPCVNRYFCRRCGANVFFRESSRLGLVDVGVGLMRASSGSRAEEWLEWGPRVSYEVEAQNEELRDRIKSGVGQKFGRNADLRTS